MSDSEMHWTELVRQAHELEPENAELRSSELTYELNLERGQYVVRNLCGREMYASGNETDAQARVSERQHDSALAACEVFAGHGFADEQEGSTTEAPFSHIYRVSRWTVETDAQGFRSMTEHGSTEEAEAYVQSIREEDAALDGTFTLTIELGNDAMQTSEDVANVLRSLADGVLEGGSRFMPGETGTMRDVNGNTVGSWTYSA